MARIFLDGFESGGDDLWDAENNATVISSAGKDMDGDYCLDLNAAVEFLEKDITADDEMYFAFLYRIVNTSYRRYLLSVMKDATILCHLDVAATTAVLTAYSGADTELATGTKALTANTTYLIEVHIKVADSGGRFEVKVDGIQDIDFTGDTKPGADTQFNKVYIGQYAGGTHGARAYYDNFIMDDAAWIGDTKIQKILPTGAGNTTGWTPSAGNNWACVDERPASDADYVSINANDTTDTYAAGDMAGDIDSVKCVQVQSRTESDGSPTPTNLKLAVRSGGTDYLSGDKVVPAAPKSLWNLWETNPNGSVAWTETTVNAVEIGIKSAA